MKAISIFALVLATSQRSRAEVSAKAARVSIHRSNEPAGSRVIATPQSGLDRSQVRASAVQAVRLGQIASGERGGI